jgi:hypothetical protein
MAIDGLTDSLPRYDPLSQELGYNNTTDRWKIELPARSSLSASGVVSVVSASGTDSIPVYLTSSIPVAVAIDIDTDSIKVFSASGTPAIETWVNNTVTTMEPDPASSKLISKRFTYNVLGDVATVKEALIATPSGSPCKLTTFTYNLAGDVDYMVDSLNTW